MTFVRSSVAHGTITVDRRRGGARAAGRPGLHRGRPGAAAQPAPADAPGPREHVPGADGRRQGPLRRRDRGRGRGRVARGVGRRRPAGGRRLRPAARGHRHPRGRQGRGAAVRALGLQHVPAHPGRRRREPVRRLRRDHHRLQREPAPARPADRAALDGGRVRGRQADDPAVDPDAASGQGGHRRHPGARARTGPRHRPRRRRRLRRQGLRRRGHPHGRAGARDRPALPLDRDALGAHGGHAPRPRAVGRFRARRHHATGRSRPYGSSCSRTRAPTPASAPSWPC